MTHSEDRGTASDGADKQEPDDAGGPGPVEAERRPIFNAPGVVLALVALFVGVHLFGVYAPEQVSNQVLLTLVFSPMRYLVGGVNWPGGAVAQVTSFVSYALLHGDWMHLGLNSFWMLAFGSVAARRLGAVRFIVFSALAAAVAAGFSLMLTWGQQTLLVGASGAVAGQMAIAVRLIFAQNGSLSSVMHRDLARTPPEPLIKLFSNRSAVIFLIIWLGVDIVVAQSGLSGVGRIAWEAHLGGFLTGLLGFALFDPYRKSP